MSCKYCLYESCKCKEIFKSYLFPRVSNFIRLVFNNKPLPKRNPPLIIKSSYLLHTIDDWIHYIRLKYESVRKGKTSFFNFFKIIKDVPKNILPKVISQFHIQPFPHFRINPRTSIFDCYQEDGKIINKYRGRLYGVISSTASTKVENIINRKFFPVNYLMENGCDPSYVDKYVLFEILQEESIKLDVMSNGKLPRYLKMEILERLNYASRFTTHELFLAT
jgi:hypothetical protein